MLTHEESFMGSGTRTFRKLEKVLSPPRVPGRHLSIDGVCYGHYGATPRAWETGNPCVRYRHTPTNPAMTSGLFRAFGEAGLARSFILSHQRGRHG
jgi:hypothetical protein